MTVATIEGRMGKGKSVTATFLAVTDWLELGRKIVANYFIDLEAINMRPLSLTERTPEIVKSLDEGKIPPEAEKLLIDAGASNVLEINKRLGKKWWIKTDIGTFILWDDKPIDKIILFAYVPEKKVAEDDWIHLDYDIFVDAMKKEETLYDKTVVVDEAYLFASSRMSMSGFNQLFSYFNLQARKRDVDLYLITQQFSNLEIRSRLNTDVRIFVSMDKVSGLCSVRLMDLGSGRRRGLKFYAPDYYPFYDTTEIPSLRPGHIRAVKL